MCFVGIRKIAVLCRLAYVFILVLAILWPARGERLPIKIYTMADGLARDRKRFTVLV